MMSAKILLSLPAVLLAAFAATSSAQPPLPGQPSPAPRAAAPNDLTGYWVSIVTEDWRWRMLTPPPGDYASVPLTPAGVEAADRWNRATDLAEGNACRPYGAGGIMRIPGRLRISWEDDNTLKIETDAGMQTRLLHFETSPPPPEPTWQGSSQASWEMVGGGRGREPTGGSLKVVTTGMKPGYVRWNGVPYGEDAVITEHFDRYSAFDRDWLTVTTIVEDPRYFEQPFIVSSDFVREPNGSAWNPTPCTIDPPVVAQSPQIGD
jgi:hypothetical protein